MYSILSTPTRFTHPRCLIFLQTFPFFTPTKHLSPPSQTNRPFPSHRPRLRSGQSPPPMATTAAAFCNFRPSPVICSGQQSKPNSANHKPSSSSSSSNWWTPLFGISSDPDYIQSSVSLKMEQSTNTTEISNQFGKPRSKFSLGCFTEEKAKELRKKTMETSNFHDVMYHSAIASRLASDVSSRREH